MPLPLMLGGLAIAAGGSIYLAARGLKPLSDNAVAIAEKAEKPVVVLAGLATIIFFAGMAAKRGR